MIKMWSYLRWVWHGFVLTAAFGVANASAQTWEFTTCGATGAQGPDQSACDTEYTGTALDGGVTVSGGIQIWTVPASGRYRVTAVGAQGTAAEASVVGGLGASLQAEFTLSAGTVLQLAIGQVGLEDTCNGGGGGGSFVVDASDEPLLVAGGGGGTRTSVLQNGCDASLTTFGIGGSGSLETSACAVKVTDEGLGGVVSSGSWGSAGAGFFGNGAVDGSGTAALSWANGALGGGSADDSSGGFGGGGGGDGSCGGGGGGGYSGGDGGRVAGGGGSFAAPAASSLVASIAGSGDGSVIIEALDVQPTAPVAVPALPALGVVLLSTLMLLAGIGRRRRMRI